MSRTEKRDKKSRSDPFGFFLGLPEKDKKEESPTVSRRFEAL